MLAIVSLAACDNTTDSNGYNYDNNGENNGDNLNEDRAIAIEIAEVDDDEYAFDILQRINDAVGATDGLEIEFTTETLVIIPFEELETALELESETTGSLFALGVDDSFEATGHIEQNHMGLYESYDVYFRENAIYIDLNESHGLGVRTPLKWKILVTIHSYGIFCETLFRLFRPKSRNDFCRPCVLF